RKDTYFRWVLEDFAKHGVTWGDFIQWIAQPSSQCRNDLWNGFFINRVQVREVLDLWTTKNSESAKTTIRQWALTYLGDLLGQEASRTTKDGVLLTPRMSISESFVLDFNLRAIHSRLFDVCPAMTTLMRKFCTTSRHARLEVKNHKTPQEEAIRVGTALVDLLGQRSQNNSYVCYIMGLYLYATGASRQTLSLLSSLNVATSYSALVGSGSTKEMVDTHHRGTSIALSLQRAFHRGAGLLRKLSTSCRASAATRAHTAPFGLVYDNINFMFKVAEQILGRKDSQENGTCATIFALQQASLSDMKASHLLERFNAAPPLSVQDIIHTPAETTLFRQSLEHTILRVIVSQSPLFERFRDAVHSCLPATDNKIPVHKTDVYPLPAMHIDESSITGNAEVIDTIFTDLGFDVNALEFGELAKLTFGDQLSISRLRSINANRAGHDALHRSFSSLVFGPGFFHHQMTLVHGIMETHWGDPQAGSQSPASLHAINTSLDRKPIVMSSLPPYRVCRDLIFTTLTGSLLHCLELVSRCESLEDYAANVEFEELQNHVTEIYDTYVRPTVASTLRQARHEELECGQEGEHFDTPPTPLHSSQANITAGDMVFENMCLFMRDALVLREFNDAIKGGYSGRIIRTLKILALMYRGSGRTKYAYEMLHIIHNLTHLWPAPLRNIMINNWLVNPTGKDDAFVPVDLLQEHLNFWIKVMYKAQGSNASWEWLEMISPCVGVLRKLATQINDSLGAHLGSKHRSPDLTKDYETICNRLREYNVLVPEAGRLIYSDNPSKGEVLNIVSAGLKQLPGPLNDYNRTFEQLQRQRRITPLALAAKPVS
ncbi:hypothetical protein DICSQDRAFT_44032, partial [Dichomitus squalens LYAD-421 SS1]